MPPTQLAHQWFANATAIVTDAAREQAQLIDLAPCNHRDTEAVRHAFRRALAEHAVDATFPNNELHARVWMSCAARDYVTVRHWLDDALAVVLQAARSQARQLSLAPDEQRDYEAYNHAYLGALNVHTANAAFPQSELHARWWMNISARNWVRDWARRARTRERYERGYLRAKAGPDLTHLCELVRSLLPELPDQLRQPVELFLTGGRTWQEIGDRLGIPLGTAYNRFRTALPILRTLLAERGIDAADLQEPFDRFLVDEDDEEDRE